jgi:hypothetical protein
MDTPASPQYPNHNPFSISHNMCEFTCPNCNAGLCLDDWDTEYGEAMAGEYDVTCPDCSHEFAVYVDTRPRITLTRV